MTTPTTPDALLACPFCEGPGHLRKFEGVPHGHGWYVTCYGEKLCPLYCTEPYSDLLSRAQAIERWNTRALARPSPQPSDAARQRAIQTLAGFIPLTGGRTIPQAVDAMIAAMQTEGEGHATAKE